MIEELSPEMYQELRKLAAHFMKSERPDHTLQPTALVHEVFLRLCERHSLDPNNRTQFIAAATQLMRHILINHAVKKNRQKRGNGQKQFSIEETGAELFLKVENGAIDILEFENLLVHLAEKDARQVRIVELRVFWGFEFSEIAEQLGVSLRTVQREWKFARSWLYSNLVNDN